MLRKCSTNRQKLFCISLKYSTRSDKKRCYRLFFLINYWCDTTFRYSFQTWNPQHPVIELYKFFSSSRPRLSINQLISNWAANHLISYEYLYQTKFTERISYTNTTIQVQLSSKIRSSYRAGGGWLDKVTKLEQTTVCVSNGS